MQNLTVKEMMKSYTLNEMADILKVHPSWLYSKTRLKGDDKIPCYKIGKYLRFNPERVLEWLQKQNEQSG